MNPLLLVRHSVVEPVAGVPAAQWQLSANGRIRCHLFAEQLRPYARTRLISSMEPKAAETGRLLADALGIPWQTAIGLHEHERQTTPYIADAAAFQATVARFFAQPEQLVLGEETAVQASTRFATAVATAIQAAPSENNLIVTHGTVMTLFVCAHNPHLTPFTFWQQLTMPYAVALSLPHFQLLATLSFTN